MGMLALLLFVSAGFCGANRISPTLSPKSDKTWAGKDYPDDLRPSAKGLPFKNTYPALQKARTYDEDFVNDENSDNGEWKAQMNYDNIRNQQKKDVVSEKDAEKKADESKKVVDKAKDAEDAAKKAHDEAEKAVEEAKKAVEDAKKKGKDGADKA